MCNDRYIEPRISQRPAISQSAISLNNGYWTTSFAGCSTGTVGNSNICDGLEVDDASYSCGGTLSRITADANYSAGGGAYGLRTYRLGNARNEGSASLAIKFNSSEKDIWTRYYIRYPAGQTWGGIVEHKMLYAFTDSLVALDVNFPQGMDSIQLQPRNTSTPDITVSGWGWHNLYGSDIGDGSWHLYEHHLSLGDSGQNNGVYQFWVDGVNRISLTELDFYNNGAVTPTKWDQFYIPSNHNVSTYPGCGAIDIDDLAVANPSWPHFVQDAGGRNMIGGVPSVGIPPAAPSGLTAN
jgi:hypothetical protein